jgi:hypothetical protein
MGKRFKKKRQGGGSRVWRWKRFKRRGRELDQESGGGRSTVKEEAGRWIKGLKVGEVYCKRRGREVDYGPGGGRGLKEEAGRWIKGPEVEEV